jgi:hypothetical protein
VSLGGRDRDAGGVSRQPRERPVSVHRQSEEDRELYFLGRIVGLMTRALDRRRTRWIEISVTRAWSHDLPPRLFNLGDL